MKHAVFAIVALAGLGGCQARPLTLEEAQAACTRKGGLLTVIYTQEITASGIGRRIGHPGECLPLSKFGTGPGSASPPAK